MSEKRGIKNFGIGRKDICFNGGKCRIRNLANIHTLALFETFKRIAHEWRTRVYLETFDETSLHCCVSKMSSKRLCSIVGGFWMLWIWAATSMVARAVILHPNETVFNDFCKKSTTCEVLKYNTCLGSPLPYTHTSLILAEDSETQEEALEKLAMWSGKLLFLLYNT